MLCSVFIAICVHTYIMQIHSMCFGGKFYILFNAVSDLLNINNVFDVVGSVDFPLVPDTVCMHYDLNLWFVFVVFVVDIFVGG